MNDSNAPGKIREAGQPTLKAERLFVLDLSGGQIISVKPDGSDRKVIVSNCRHPDGIVVDIDSGHIFWTEMGVPHLNDGSIERADLDGSNKVSIVTQGGTFTPKQIHLDKKNAKLYWSDREGMRVMRCNLDGSNIEILIETGSGTEDRKDQKKWCVGITVDAAQGKFYWTQKGFDDAGQGRIFRANIEIAKGETPTKRSDIEVLFGDLPEPIDLELDLGTRTIYWTDRGDPPRGNTVNRAPMDLKAGEQVMPEILMTHLMEGIGLALDHKGGRMFVTDLGGTVYSANLDGSGKKVLLAAQGNLTGIAYADLTAKRQ